MSDQSWTDITYWFNPGTLAGLEYERDWLFYTALFSPLIVLIPLLLQAVITSYSRHDLKASADPLYRFSFSSFLKLIPFVLFSGALFLMTIALAGPYKSEEHSETWTEGIDILLILDVSGSMDTQDFSPNRLEKVKEVALNFIEGRNSDKIGLIEFAGEAFSRAPLTTDHENLKTHIRKISLKDLEDAQGTAIGNALGLGAFRMENSESNSKVIILISDGDNTAGNIQPEYAAEQANKAGIKVYSVGVGTNKTSITKKIGFFETQIPIPPLNEHTLKQIAAATGGKYFRATNSSGLESIFKTINKLETREIKESHYRTTKQYYFVYLTWGIVLLLGWLAVKASFISNGTLD
jgi:Ca-activated chloride channel family protein